MGFEKVVGQRKGFPFRYVVLASIFIVIVASVIMRDNLAMAIVSIALCGDNATEVPFLANGSLPEDYEPPAPRYAWSDTIQGLLLGGFFWSNMVVRIPASRLSEKHGARYFVALYLLGSVLVNVLTPFLTSSWPLMFSSRLVLGASQGGITPSVYGVIAAWLPQKERSFGFSILTLAQQIGKFVASPLAGVLSEFGFAGGWPSVFYTSGAIGVVALVAWLALAQDKPEKSRLVSLEELIYIQDGERRASSAAVVKVNPPVPWRAIFTSRPVLAYFLSRFLSGWNETVFQSRLPSYIKTVLNLSNTRVSKLQPGDCKT